MTARIPENVSTWLVDWSIVTTMGNTMPPRDPNDDDDDDTEDEEGETTTSSRRPSENPMNSPHAPQLSRRELTWPPGPHAASAVFGLAVPVPRWAEKRGAMV
jgi:hypothetical protein